VSFIVTLVGAVLALIVSASALSAQHEGQPLYNALHDTAPAPDHREQTLRDDIFRDDPILNSQWGPGNPDLVVPQFHFSLSHDLPGPRLDLGGDQVDPREIADNSPENPMPRLTP
jgi:hypothetical protein